MDNSLTGRMETANGLIYEVSEGDLPGCTLVDEWCDVLIYPLSILYLDCTREHYKSLNWKLILWSHQIQNLLLGARPCFKVGSGIVWFPKSVEG
jgi:hypothetical protein